MAELDLDAIEARAAAVTQAVWNCDRPATELAQSRSAADVPALVAENRALRAEVERLRQPRTNGVFPG